jgi:hypothetical protein
VAGKRAVVHPVKPSSNDFYLNSNSYVMPRLARGIHASAGTILSG